MKYNPETNAKEIVSVLDLPISQSAIDYITMHLKLAYNSGRVADDGEELTKMIPTEAQDEN